MQWTTAIFDYVEEYVELECWPFITNAARPALTEAIEQWLPYLALSQSRDNEDRPIVKEID